MPNFAPLPILLAFGLIASTPIRAAVTAIIPQCCTNASSLTVLDARTGSIKESLFTALTPAAQLTGQEIALSIDGARAFAVSFTTANTGENWVLSSVPLNGVGANVTIDLPGNYPDVAVNPKSGLVYVSYQAGGLGHLRVLNRETLALLDDVSGVRAQLMTFSPGGSSYSAPSTRAWKSLASQI